MYLLCIGPRPLDVFLKAFPYRLFMGVVFMMCVWWANVVRGPGQESFPTHFYVTILLVYAVHQVLECATCMCFFESCFNIPTFSLCSDASILWAKFGGGGGGGGVVLLVLLAFLSPVLSFVGVGVAGGQAMLSPSPRSGTALYILHLLVCNPGFSKEFCIPLAIHKG